MSKETLTYVAAYLAAGIAVTAWTASLGESGKSHFTPYGGNQTAQMGILQNIALWPLAAYQNLTLNMKA